MNSAIRMKDSLVKLLAVAGIVACSAEVSVVDKRKAGVNSNQPGNGADAKSTATPSDVSDTLVEEVKTDTVKELKSEINLTLGSEVNVAAFGDGFVGSIIGVAKLDAETTIFYGQNSESWILKEGNAFNELQRIPSSVFRNEGTDIYVLPEQFFWLIDRAQGALSFPDPNADNSGAQINLLTVQPKLLREDSAKAKVLFVDESRVILSNGSSANILSRKAADVTQISTDFPKIEDKNFEAVIAGITNRDNNFWFLGSQGILIMTIGEDSTVTWSQGPASLKAGGADGEMSNLESLSMFLEFDSDEQVRQKGYVFSKASGQIFHEKNISFVPFDITLKTDFEENVQPILEGLSCGASCHGGTDYTNYEVVREKAELVRMRMNTLDGIMPQGATEVSQPVIDTVNPWLQRAVIPSQQ